MRREKKHETEIQKKNNKINITQSDIRVLRIYNEIFCLRIVAAIQCGVHAYKQTRGTGFRELILQNRRRW